MSSIRSAAERATHWIVLRRRLPAPFEGAHIYVSSEGGLRYLRPTLTDVDPQLLRNAAELIQPGNVVWDFGGNVGLFSIPAAHRAGADGRVITVEADTWNVGMLRRSAAALPESAARMDVIPAAVSDKLGFATFNIATRNRSTNALDGLGSTQMGGVREAQTVPTVTMDAMLDSFPAPDVIKMDVEGAELLALRGATEVLKRRPVILCEVGNGHDTAVRGLLSGAGYSCWDADVPGRVPVGETRSNSYNLLATPD